MCFVDQLGADRVLGGLAMIGANIVQPGLIRHFALNWLEFGEIGGAISESGAEVIFPPDIVCGYLFVLLTYPFLRRASA